MDLTNLKSFITDNLVPIALVIIALGIFFHARKGANSVIVQICVGLFIGLMVLAVALEPNLQKSVGSWGLNLIGITGDAPQPEPAK